MIGPPPSFYDPNQATVPEGLDYQQWIMENYPASSAQAQQQQQQQQQFAFAQGMAAAGTFQQQSQIHHVPPTHNQYNFVQEYDTAPSFDTHIVQPATDRPQRGLPQTRISGARRGVYQNAPQPQVRVPSSGSFPQQPPQPSPSHPYPLQSPAGEQSYYFGVPATNAAAEQQQQQPAPPPPQQQFSFTSYQHPDQYASASANYTPTSDLATLPSSVSTPSVGGTDDGQARAYPLISQHGQPPHPQQASTSRTGAPPSASARARPARKVPPKRQRVEESFDADSDTQSDDDGPLHGGFTTVNVPPPQGQSSLPARL